MNMSILDLVKAQIDKENETEILYIDGIDYLHPEYKRYYDRWQKIRDVIEGQEAVKDTSVRERYLPRLSGHTQTLEGQQSYEAFVGYAELYNATGRTVDAYRGLLNRKLPSVTVPDALDYVLDDFTIKGESIYTFIEQLEVELITTNRVGVFVDYPYVDPDSKLSKADMARMNMNPYATMYPAESIINWEETRINNKIVTSLVVLKEVDYVRLTSVMPMEQITYRVLELDENGFYRQIIIHPEYLNTLSGNSRVQGSRYIVKGTVYPKQNGQYMRYIPFFPVTAQGVTWNMSKSVIEDLVNVNIAHYRDTAFHQKAIAWTASPTAVFSGLPDDVPSVSIGSEDAILIAIGGTAKYLEYEGKGLEDIANALHSKENQMAILGAKILANTAGKAESGEAALIHRAGEQGILADIATTVGVAMEKALGIIAAWKGLKPAKGEIKIEINKDFNPGVMDANTILALGKELDEGRISYESYMYALQRGEILPPERTPDEEKRLISNRFKGTAISKETLVKYLDKKDINSILGRDDTVMDKKHKSTEPNMDTSNDDSADSDDAEEDMEE